MTTIKTTVNQSEFFKVLAFLEGSVLRLEECSNKAGGGFAIEITTKTAQVGVSAEISTAAKSAFAGLLEILLP